jgi:peptidoglycan hydrolase-like protein with peptidoglycan-binding domain
MTTRSSGPSICLARNPDERRYLGPSKLGDSGPSVIDLQNLLGISPSGMFGDETDQAVRSFQASHNLVVDGIVGSHTWGVLSESPIRVAGGRNVGASVGGSIGSLSPALIDQIVKLAGASELARVDWEDRGAAPDPR